MKDMVKSWIDTNPELDKNKIKKLAECVFYFLKKNYDDNLLGHFWDINLCIDCEDESGTNGFWDATHYLIKEKYDIIFTNDNDDACQEQENLYYVLSAMREFYFSDIMKDKYKEVSDGA